MTVITAKVVQQILTGSGITARGLRIEPLRGGSVNKLYKLCWDYGTLVLWLDGKAREIRWGARGSKLRWIYTSLSGLGLPVPQLLHAAESDSLIPYSYLLLTYLPGQQLAQILASIDSSQELILARATGRMLGKLHRVTGSAIEDFRRNAIACGGSGRYGNPFNSLECASTWFAYVEQQLNAQRAVHVRAGALRDWYLAAIRFIEERRVLWADPRHCEAAVLVHSDFSPRNIHVQHGINKLWSVCGVFDFEWALIGPAEMDFAKLEAYAFPRLNTLQRNADYREAFRESYQQEYPLASMHDDLVITYRMLFFLIWAGLERDRGNASKLREAEDAIKRILRKT